MNCRISLTIFLLLLAGCKYSLPGGTVPGKASSFMESASNATANLSVLSFVGALCLISGMVLLAVTSGRKGWYPVIGGLVMVLLNYGVARYSDLLFYPLIACTGLISGAWAYKTIRQIILEKKTK